MEIKNHQVAGSGLTARKSSLCTMAQSWKLTGRGALSVAGGSADKAGGGGLRLSPGSQVLRASCSRALVRLAKRWKRTAVGVRRSGGFQGRGQVRRKEESF